MRRAPKEERARRARRLAPIALVLGLAACGSSPEAKEAHAAEPAAVEASAGPAIVVGTTVDARSGERLGGVLVEGPGGVRTRSGPDGRFRLRGLPVGTEGELVARGEGGLVGRNLLRPLALGELEVVIYLRPERRPDR